MSGAGGVSRDDVRVRLGLVVPPMGEETSGQHARSFTGETPGSLGACSYA